MKHEWRKHEKGIYIPKKKPEFVRLPSFKYFTIEGKGNPNSDIFTECIGALYALSYAMKMTIKKDPQPIDYLDYTVYPLEGVWDLNEEGRRNFNGTINKDDLVYKLMIRQPDFVSEEYAKQIIAKTQEKKANPLLDTVRFELLEEGPCVQMMHIGSYDNEVVSFDIMEAFAEQENLTRLSKVHKEIYLSDFRRVPEEKLKTVLRFKVEE